MANSYKWNGISDSETKVKAEDLMDGIEAAESFLNHGIGPTSFANPVEVLLNEDGLDSTTGYSRPNHTSDGYIDQRHIFKPDFYDSPAPRMEAVSSQVHFRGTAGSMEKAVIFNPSATGGSWEVIPGTSCRLKLRDHADVYFQSSFYCFEVGGVQWPKNIAGRAGETRDYKDYGGQTNYSGTVGLSVHGRDGSVQKAWGSTYREVYTSSLFPVGSNVGGSDGALQGNGFIMMTMQGRQQHSIIKRFSLPPGVYDVGLSFSSCETSDGFRSRARSIHEASLKNYSGEVDGGNIPASKNVIFCARSMVCDAVYKQRADASEELEPWRTRNEIDPQAI